MAALSLSMSNKKIALPESIAVLMRYLCPTARELQRTFQISLNLAVNINRKRPVKVSAKQLDIIQSVCSNEINYAFSTRISTIMQSETSAPVFVAWVNTAAAMLDRFKSLQAFADASTFIAREDPFLAPLYHLSTSMDEVTAFLQQLHQKCPQFDGLFFRGTRFLDGEKASPTPPASRVPSSVDILSLSPEDERMYQQFKEQQ